MLGQNILHYSITDRLGAGGMGVVYKALDLKLQRTVALKFLPHEVAVTAQDKERLLREARAASALDHPNIGVIYGLEETSDRQLFIVMGYYEGETLAQKMGRGLVPIRESLDLAIQIASGLAAAHARNIVHRDVKPSNIILTKDNIAKIVDFGLARVVAGSSATQTLNTSGTLPYMAPEQVLGDPVDQHADVWALGVVLVQMLTGSHPFLRESPAAMTFAILNQPPAGLEGIPAFVQPIAYRALSKDAKHRYGNGKEMQTDLDAARVQLSASGRLAAPDQATLTSNISVRELKEYAERASTPRWSVAQAKKSKRWLYIAGAAVLLAAASLLLPAVRGRLAALLNASNEKHIAVLPFDNIGNDPANEPVAEGLMDSLTSKLSNLDAAQQSLWVVPASIVRTRKVDDPSAALRMLGATLVVKGSIQREGQDVHLTVNLINSKTLRQIGSVALEDRVGDLSTLQDETVARLARLMNINVTADMLRTTGGSANPAAYESYLKALGYIQRWDKAGNLDKAITELGDAVKVDPHFALGFAELGEAYRLKYQVDPNPRWSDEAAANCSHAVQLNDRLPAVYVTLAHLHSKLGKYDLAAQESQQALQLDPHNADALTAMAGAYERAGKLADAEATFRRAVALRPDYWDGYNNLGLFYDRHGRSKDALAQYRRVLEMTPDNAPVHSNIGVTYLNLEKQPEAESAFKKSIELSPSYFAYANLGTLYYSEKRFAESAAVTEKALALNDKDYRVWANLTASYQWLKETKKANEARLHELELLESLVKVESHDAIAQSELASLYAELNMRDKALIRIQTALEIAPDDSRVLVSLLNSIWIPRAVPHATSCALPQRRVRICR